MTIEELREKWQGRIVMLIAIGAGWAGIVDAALEQMIAIDPSVSITQVKEKFGSLRIYYRTTDEHRDAISAIVDAATEQVRGTCDVCGTINFVEKFSDGGWLRVRCDTHRNTR